MAVIGAKGNFGGPGASSAEDDDSKQEIVCTQEDTISAILLSSVGLFGACTNLFLILIIFVHKHLRRWNYGLVVHQAVIELSRSVVLLPLGKSLINCHVIENCSFIETLFLLFVSISTINLLTCVLDSTPILPEDIGKDSQKILKNGPQCVLFGIFIIWFSSITLNLGPTFLSGAIASASASYHQPSCPLVQPCKIYFFLHIKRICLLSAKSFHYYNICIGPGRHYVSNALWIIINIFCLLVTFYQLRRLDLEYKQRQSILTLVQNDNLKSAMSKKIQMYWLISILHACCWIPLYLDTLIWTTSSHQSSLSHEISLHLGFLHSGLNPLLHLLLDSKIRQALFKIFSCSDYNKENDFAEDEKDKTENVLETQV